MQRMPGQALVTATGPSIRCDLVPALSCGCDQGRPHLRGGATEAQSDAVAYTRRPPDLCTI